MNTHTQIAQIGCYMVSHWSGFLTATGCSFEERFERRSGGRGAFFAENAGPVWCLPPQTGYEGMQKKEKWLSLANANDVLEHTCSKNHWPQFHLSFSLLNDSYHFYVLFCGSFIFEICSVTSDFKISVFLFQGIGTDEATLIEILASRTNMEILDIKNAYKEGLLMKKN